MIEIALKLLVYFSSKLSQFKSPGFERAKGSVRDLQRFTAFAIRSGSSRIMRAPDFRIIAKRKGLLTQNNTAFLILDGW